MLDVARWPSVPPEVVPENRRAAFTQRLRACELYCAGELGSRAVGERIGLSARQVQRLVRSALAWHEDGQIFGQRALIPYLNRRGYERRAADCEGTAGLFDQLLRRYPQVREQIVTAYCEQGKRLKDIHRQMLLSLAALGVTPTEYPFNKQRRAAGALHQFCQSLLSERFRQIAFVRHGRDAGRRADKTQESAVHRHILRPFTRVEVDGHKIDAIFVLSIEGADGLTRTVTLHRLIVIVLIDVASRAILGYSLCLNRTESHGDLLTAIERSLSDAAPLEITERGLSVRADSGLPVHVVPNCSFRVPDEFAFDNSLAASSIPWQDRLAENLHCRINVGTAGAPEGRGVVESFFKKLTENGFQRLPSTTGGSARSPKRRDPEAKAHRFQITLAAAEQLLQVLVAEYNNTVHGTTGHTPLDYIRSFDRGGGLIRRLPQEARALNFLFEQTVVLKVRGGVRTGTRPYVQYVGVRYRSSQLSHHGEARVGTPLTAVLDRRNIALIRLFLPTGEPLGVAKAQGRWGLSPHSLKTRRAIFSLEKAGILSPIAADPVDSFTTYLAKAARTRRAAANEWARVRGERGVPREATRHLVATESAPPGPSSAGLRSLRSADVKPRGSAAQLTLGTRVHIRRAVRG
jgi:putative transposase